MTIEYDGDGNLSIQIEKVSIIDNISSKKRKPNTAGQGWLAGCLLY